MRKQQEDDFRMTDCLPDLNTFILLTVCLHCAAGM